jgi:hypothetical protein
MTIRGRLPEKGRDGGGLDFVIDCLPGIRLEANLGDPAPDHKELFSELT